MGRFTRAELEAYTGATLPDLLGDRVELLFVGINPGLLTAAVQAHFARRGNRFYPALFRAGPEPPELQAHLQVSIARLRAERAERFRRLRERIDEARARGSRRSARI